MSVPPPRAPTFPNLDDSVHEVDDSDFVDDDAPPVPPIPLRHRRSPMLSSTPLSSSTATNIPVVPLPTASRSSRIGAIILWRQPRITATFLALPILFFYATLIRGISPISALGVATVLHAIFRLTVSIAPRYTSSPIHPLLCRPDDDCPLVSRELAIRLADIAADELNHAQHSIRHLIYCDNPSVAAALGAFGLLLYLIGNLVSPIAVLFVATIALFTLPLAYDRNRSQVDHAVAVACRQVEQRSAALLDKAPPAARQLANRVGLTSDAQLPCSPAFKKAQ